jgi:serine/threonine protein kinase
VFAIDEEDGLPVIVMEHLEGRPLSELTEGGVAPVEAEKITLQIASGLAAAHEENIVHGDLKPANIMVTEQGMPKILDFGLARSQRTTTSSDDIGKDAAVPDAMLAASGAPDDLAGTVDHVPSPANQAETRSASADGIHGTPAYMSPEQAAGRSSTVATDVFALGLVFFEMLTGRRALADESLPQILRRLSDDNLGADLASQVDPKFRSVLAAMLARAADDRPSMIDVVNHLRQ